MIIMTMWLTLRRREEENLPADLREAIRDELARMIMEPSGTLLCLIANGLLVTVLWFFAPIDLYDLIFNLHGIFYFPIVLASWMISDVPATNESAPDSKRMLTAMGDAAMITRLYRAKHLVLWLFVTPVVITVAAIVGGSTGDWLTMVLVIGYVASVPLSSLGISCLLGIIWPYHPISLKERWVRRSEWKHLWLRWGILIVVPYMLVPALGMIAMAPTLWIFHNVQIHHLHLDHSHIVVGLIVTVPIAAWVWFWGTRYAAKLTMKREVQLRRYLSDPSLG